MKRYTVTNHMTVEIDSESSPTWSRTRHPDHTQRKTFCVSASDMGLVDFHETISVNGQTLHAVEKIEDLTGEFSGVVYESANIRNTGIVLHILND